MPGIKKIIDYQNFIEKFNKKIRYFAKKSDYYQTSPVFSQMEAHSIELLIFQQPVSYLSRRWDQAAFVIPLNCKKIAIIFLH